MVINHMCWSIEYIIFFPAKKFIDTCLSNKKPPNQLGGLGIPKNLKSEDFQPIQLKAGSPTRAPGMTIVMERVALLVGFFIRLSLPKERSVVNRGLGLCKVTQVLNKIITYISIAHILSMG